MIIIDSRELRSKIPELLQRYYIPTTSVSLEVFDYIISDGIHTLGVERKKADDYISSMIDGRLNNQLYQMSFNQPTSILIIEGNIRNELIDRNISRQQYYANIASIVGKRSPDGVSGVVSIYSVENEYDTALFLKYVHDIFIKEDGTVRLPKMVRAKFNPSKRLIYYMEGFPNIGEKTAHDLLSHFTTIKNVVNASVDQLMEVKGIGKKTAEKIYEIVNMEYKNESV